jgi:hypothetical protein
MPKLKETLLQVKQRQSRELKARTQARCAELLRGTSHQQSSRHHSILQPLSICPCCTCRTANQSSLVSNAANYIFDEDEQGSSSEADEVIHRPLQEWSLCLNVSCFLLILFAANCLLLQYFLLYKAI